MTSLATEAPIEKLQEAFEAYKQAVRTAVHHGRKDRADAYAEKARDLKARIERLEGRSNVGRETDRRRSTKAKLLENVGHGIDMLLPEMFEPFGDAVGQAAREVTGISPEQYRAGVVDPREEQMGNAIGDFATIAPLMMGSAPALLPARVATGAAEGALAAGVTGEDPIEGALWGGGIPLAFGGAGAVTNTIRPAGRAIAPKFELLHRNVSDTLSTTFDDAMGSIRRAKNTAAKPYRATLDALESSNKQVGTRWTAQSLMDDADFVGARPEVYKKIAGTGFLDGSPQTVGGARAAKRVMSDAASEAGRNGRLQESRLYSRTAKAIGEDLDEAVNGVNSRVSSQYRRNVGIPYGGRTVNRAIGIAGDHQQAQKAWDALRQAKGREVFDLAEGLKSNDPKAFQTVRQRILADIIEREHEFHALQAGSGHPVSRAFKSRGWLDAFFTPEEAQAIMTQTGITAAARNPITRAVAVAIGGATGGLAGLSYAAALEVLVSTRAGRRLLFASSKMTQSELIEGVGRLLRTNIAANNIDPLTAVEGGSEILSSRLASGESQADVESE